MRWRSDLWQWVASQKTENTQFCQHQHTCTYTRVPRVCRRSRKDTCGDFRSNVSFFLPPPVSMWGDPIWPPLTGQGIQTQTELVIKFLHWLTLYHKILCRESPLDFTINTLTTPCRQSYTYWPLSSATPQESKHLWPWKSNLTVNGDAFIWCSHPEPLLSREEDLCVCVCAGEGRFVKTDGW